MKKTCLSILSLFVLFTIPSINLAARTINFAGYTWQVKSSTSPVGPGPNYFSDDTAKVWLDTDGVHLTISTANGHWQCTEILLQNSLGYGYYIFQTHGRLDILDKNMVAGFFTYDNSAPPYYRELDFESSRWGNASDTTNSQYVVQPSGSGLRVRYTANLTSLDQDLTMLMIWSAGTVKFYTYHGKQTLGSLVPSDLIASWTNTSGYVPTPGNETFRVNFWLYQGNAPSSGQGDEIVVTDFKYYPINYQFSINTISRYMWCWSNSSITNNIGTARSDLYNFCSAPFGDTTKAITYLYYYAHSDISGNVTNLRNFLSDAHSHGLKVLFLDGDPNWVTSSANRVYAENLVESVLSFNTAGSADQRFDGIQYDIEPYGLVGWSSNESTYWSTFMTLLTNCQSKISTYNANNSPAIYFEEAIPRWYDSDADPITSSDQIQSIIDSVAIMDYVNDSTSIINGASGEISYGDSHGKKVVIGVETQNITPATSTFYGLGNYAMEIQLATVNNTFSSHSSYQGIAIHQYNSYRNLFNPSTTSFQGGFIWDFDSATTMPSSIGKFGYFYAYMSSTVAGKGINGTNALQITVPARTRTFGGGVHLIASPPLDLSSAPEMYGFVSADSTNPFGVVFEVYDITGGNPFIPPPGPYASSAQMFAGSINSTFKRVQFDLRTFNRYQSSGAPNLSAIKQMTWLFPDNTTSSTGPLHFYLDNIGAGAQDINDWSIYASPEKTSLHQMQ